MEHNTAEERKAKQTSRNQRRERRGGTTHTVSLLVPLMTSAKRSKLVLFTEDIK